MGIWSRHWPEKEPGNTIPTRQKCEKKGQKSREEAKKVIVASPKHKSASDQQDTEKKRSESHWFKQTENLLTMDCGHRGARARIHTKHQG